MNFNLKIVGLDKLQSALAKFPQQITQSIASAGKESAEDVIFPTEGLKRYPPGSSNRYIRGRGTQTLTRNYNDSERYGTNFYSRNEGTKTLIGNRTSYAQWLTDENRQSSVMAKKGWRKMVDVIQEKIGGVVRVYQSWVDKTIKDLGL